MVFYSDPVVWDHRLLAGSPIGLRYPTCVLEIIEDGFVTETLFVAGDGHQKKFEPAHALVTHLITALREKRIPRAGKENGKSFHAALLGGRGRIKIKILQIQMCFAGVEPGVKITGLMFGKLFFSNIGTQ